jgi:BirA family biotin operon repressor/biotin-[acetyl-CoA-carboxylase] ligase
LLEVVPTTGSTSADLAARLTQGERVAEGAWLIADRQTAGKGRQGREWRDGAGNFMGSTVVHLRAGDPSPETLALVAGLALHEVVNPKLSEPAVLKWPNDVLVGGAKLAGILLERVGEAVIVGIGVNLVQAPQIADRTTTSLADLGVAADRDAFAADLARQFATDLDRWRSFGLGPIVSRWIAAGHALGTPLEADDAGARLQGTFAGLTDTGALQLRLADGTLRAIHAGEVRIA